MRIIVIGCGRMGATLAYQLFRKQHQVTVMDRTASAFVNLHPDFRGRTLECEVLNEHMLERAGIQEADALAAVTSSDAINVVVCHTARTIYNVPNVVSRNYEPRWLPLHEAFDLKTVSSAAWGADRIEDMLINTELRPVLAAGHGEVEIYEFSTPEAWAGRLLANVLPAQAIPAVVTRAGRALLPVPEFRLEAGDIIHASASSEGVASLRSQLAQAQEV